MARTTIDGSNSAHVPERYSGLDKPNDAQLFSHTNAKFANNKQYITDCPARDGCLMANYIYAVIPVEDTYRTRRKEEYNSYPQLFLSFL